MIKWMPLSPMLDVEDRSYEEALDIRLGEMFQKIWRSLQAKESFRFYYDDLSASLTNEELHVESAIPAYLVLVNAYIIGIGVYSNEARTAGSATFYPAINGVALTDSVVLDGTNDQEHRAELARTATNLVVPGDRITIEVTTSADWAPGSADIIAAVLIEHIGE